MAFLPSNVSPGHDPPYTERFWVEQPADLFRIPRWNGSSAPGRFNDATRLLVLIIVVLILLKLKYWLIVLLVGLLVIIFVYYNRHYGDKDLNIEMYRPNSQQRSTSSRATQEQSGATYEEDNYPSRTHTRRVAKQTSVSASGISEPNTEATTVDLSSLIRPSVHPSSVPTTGHSARSIARPNNVVKDTVPSNTARGNTIHPIPLPTPNVPVAVPMLKVATPNVPTPSTETIPTSAPISTKFRYRAHVATNRTRHSQPSPYMEMLHDSLDLDRRAILDEDDTMPTSTVSAAYRY